MGLEYADVKAALHATGGNVGRAARKLGASRRTLQNRMREYGIPRGRAGRRKRRLHYHRVSRTAVGALVGAAAIAAAAVLLRRPSTSA